MTTLTREQVAQPSLMARLDKQQRIDEILSNPVEIFEKVRNLETTIAEQAKEINEGAIQFLDLSAEICSLKKDVQHLQMALADTEALELGAGERIAKQAKQLQEMAEAIRVKDEALAAIATEPGCGCSFPCRCDNPTGNRIEIEARMDIASEALAIQPSPEILDERDQRVAEAIAVWFDQHPLTAWVATHIRSGKWKEK